MGNDKQKKQRPDEGEQTDVERRNEEAFREQEIREADPAGAREKAEQDQAQE